MTDLENRLCQLEQQVRAHVVALQSAQTALSQLSQAVRNQQQGGFGGGGDGGGGYVYTIAPQVITAASSAAGVTVSAMLSGTPTALSGTFTVYNVMASDTVATAGKTIIVGKNPDGSFTAITQSC